MSASPFRIRPVRLTEKTIQRLQRLDHACFGSSAPALTKSEILRGYWWFVYHPSEPAAVAYAGLTPSTYGPRVGYLKRAGVLEAFRGNGLQKRLLRVRERKARALGWKAIVTDTTDNPASANSLIAAGYKIFTPDFPWGFSSTIYWRKYL